MYFSLTQSYLTTLGNIGQVPQVKEVGEEDADAAVKEKEDTPSSPVSVREFGAKVVRGTGGMVGDWYQSEKEVYL